MKSRYKKILYKENWHFVLLLALSAAVLYFLPILKLPFFSLTLYYFFRSKKNYFWLAYYWIIIIDVGGFFRTLTDDLISIGPVNISLLMVYSIVSFAKLKNNVPRVKFFLKRNMNLWVFYLLFLLYLGFVIIGNSGGGKSGLRYYFLVGKMLPGILILYTSYRFIPDKYSLLHFSRLVFLAIFLNIFGQFLHLVLGNPVFSFFLTDKEAMNEFIDKDDFTKKLIRPIWGTFQALTVGVFLSLYWFFNKKHYFKNYYLFIILVISTFSIFITAMRGWAIALIGFYLALLVVMDFKAKRQVMQILGIALISFFLLFVSNETVRIQTSSVFERLSTISLILEGDLTAGGTNSRLTDRNDPVMKLFYKRPIFGSGFSFEGLETNDQHVGNQNALMGGGIVGYFIVLLMWIRIVYISFKSHSYNSKYRNYYGETLIVIPFLFSLLIIHSSSTSIFEYLVYVKHPGKFMNIGIIFAIMNQVVLYYKTD